MINTANLLPTIISPKKTFEKGMEKSKKSQQILSFSQANSILESRQFFIEISDDIHIVKCGRFIERKLKVIEKEYFTQVEDQLNWSMDTAVKKVLGEMRKMPLFFIHGFVGAKSRLAQKTVLGFKYFYLQDHSSVNYNIMHIVWGSTKLNYGHSKRVIANSAKSLGRLINQLAQKSPTKKINLLCHSMGSQFLLETMKAGYLSDCVVDKMIFAAADFDSKDFILQEKRVTDFAEKILILYHKRDRILAAASVRNNGLRLGQKKPTKMNASQFVFLDCTHFKIEHTLVAKWNKHTYFLASDEVRGYLHEFLGKGKIKTFM